MCGDDLILLDLSLSGLDSICDVVVVSRQSARNGV